MNKTEDFDMQKDSIFELPINAPDEQDKILLTYEDGTLVLTGLSPTTWALDDTLPDYLIWDPRIRAYRSPAYRYDFLKRWIRTLPMETTDHSAEWLRVPGPVFRAPALRDYQQEAIRVWEQVGGRGIIALPTGSGKTHVALAAMAKLCLPALVLVPTRVLMTQWIDELRTVYDGEVGQLGDGVRRIRVVTVSTFESGYRHMERFGARFGFLVVDEAHHFASGLRAEALEMIPAPRRLGLTATPPANPEQASLLADLVGPVVFGKAVTEMAGTYLSDYEIITIGVDLTPEEELHYNRHKSIFLGFFRRFKVENPSGCWSDFVTWTRNEEGGSSALRAWHAAKSALSLPIQKKKLVRDLLEKHSDCRVIVFTRDNEAAYTIAKEFLIPAITCHTKRKERESVLESFRKGEVKALVSARVLNEGLDVPDAEVAIITGGAMGDREHLQRVGRVLRRKKNKIAKIYELVASETMESKKAMQHAKTLSFRPVESPGTAVSNMGRTP